MNGTPRLRSAYPSTPRNTGGRADPVKTRSVPATGSTATTADAATHGSSPSDNNGPLIPLSVIDAPTQRLYVSAFYLALTSWRVYDCWSLNSGDTEAFWFILKWITIDGICLFGLPGMQIPWLEWSPTTTTLLFLCHAVFDIWLAWGAPMPLEVVSLWIIKKVWHRELAVSERRVRPEALLRNSSLILGKQIIHILPEGSAMLNPNEDPFCISPSKRSVDLPILINQTVPVTFELLRIDLDTSANETITLSSKEIRRLKTDKSLTKKDASKPRTIFYPVKQTGLYRLLKVVDESKLEVQRKSSDILVVTCPSGSVKRVTSDKCRGELSDFYLQVDATPPLKIKYSKTINREDQSHVSLTVHPENLDTPLSQILTSGTLVKTGSEDVDVSWAQARRIQVPVNETLGTKGDWLYAIDEIEDGVGNIVNYAHERSKSAKSSIEVATSQSFVVHERPRAIMEGCNLQSPLKVAKGRSRRLPVRFNPTGHFATGSTHYVTYTFDPEEAGEQVGADGTVAKTESVVIGDSEREPEISNPGLYSLVSVSTKYCTGEILEPSSCALTNPPEPELTITSEGIPHQCAGNSIGLRVDLDMIGTPPFEIAYNVHHKGYGKSVKVEKIREMRTQLEFKPREAGQYVYEFTEISDAVYRKPHSLKDANFRLEQDVKPTAWATFAERAPQQKACIQEPATFKVHLSGESPWVLEYDLVHNGKRSKHRISDIHEAYYTLITPNLNEGGQYSMSLTSITDVAGCRIHLKEEAKIDVRMQRPTAAFGLIEGGRSALTLQNKMINLPLRFSGEPPWTLSYSRSGEEDRVYQHRFQAANDVLNADVADVYDLLDVSDKYCPGSVDPKAKQFEVLWIPRPTVQLSKLSAVELVGDIYHKKAVCEGDQDAMDLSFTGNSPYHIKYDVHMKPERGMSGVSTKQDKFGLHTASLRMETAKPGVYRYSIKELGDRLYDHDRKESPNLQVQQQVHGRPTASFLNAGKTYNYCKEDAVGDEVVPITLAGMPPFSIEIGIKHHTAMTPESIHIPNIPTNGYNFHIPHTALSLGLHSVTIRKVTDANGCQRDMGIDAPTTRVTVVDVPDISPMESGEDFCVGDRLSYTLAGTPPFRVYYSFEGAQQKASEPTNTFRRIAERPGNFTITAISDKASSESCRARTNLTRIIHALPSVRISKGQTSELDIHEGRETELLFEFEGTPPFQFTWTRSTNAIKGKKTRLLETKTEVSHEHSKSVSVSQEGTYEVVAIHDRHCGFSMQKKGGKSEQQLLTF